MAADELGGRVDHQVGAELQRVLEQRAQKRVVHGHDHLPPVTAAACHLHTVRDVDEIVRGVRRCLDEDHPEMVRRVLVTQDLLRRRGPLHPSGKADHPDPEPRQHMGEEVLRPAV